MTDDQGGGDPVPEDQPVEQQQPEQPAVETEPIPGPDVHQPDEAESADLIASLLALDGTVPEQERPIPDRGAPAEGPAPGGLPVTDDGRGFIWNPAPREGDIDTTGSLGQHIQVANADGHINLAEYVPDDNGDRRVRYAVTVIETKVPHAQRFTRGMLDTPEQEADRHYSSLFPPLDPDDPTSQLGAADAPDDDPVHGVGVESWWRAYMTVDEVEAARAAESTKHVTYETRFEPR